MLTLRLSEIYFSEFNLHPLELAAVLRDREQVFLEVSQLCGSSLAPAFLLCRTTLSALLSSHVSTPAICSASHTSARFIRGVGSAM